MRRSSLSTSRQVASIRFLSLLLSALTLCEPGSAADDELPAGSHREKTIITSSLDGTEQPCWIILPPGYDKRSPAVPLLVALHTWSGGLEQRHTELERAALERGWIYLFPHFRGRNDQPDACGSDKARRDILDAVAWAKKHHAVDASRVYLTGVSGGGHMTLLMVARHPEVWTAASAWAGISDLTEWHRFQARSSYGEMMRRVCGGAPGTSAEVTAEFYQRSPIHFLEAATNVPLDIATGVHDGHRGSVPVWHSVAAYNVVAAAAGGEVVAAGDIKDLSRQNGHLRNPQASDQVVDPTYGRVIHLRRSAGKVRLTIFEGGHEMLPAASVAWLSQHRKNSPQK